MSVKIGDRVRIVNAVTDSMECFGYKNGQEYKVKEIDCGLPCIWPDGTDDSSVFLHEDEYEVVSSESVYPPKSLAEQLDEARAKVAELERLIAEESRLKVGDYARITEESAPLDGSVEVGDIVSVMDVEDCDEDAYPFWVQKVFGTEMDYDWVSTAERLTPEEARAAMIAKIDAIFEGARP